LLPRGGQRTGRSLAADDHIPLAERAPVRAPAHSRSSLPCLPKLIPTSLQPAGRCTRLFQAEDRDMGKYFIAWLLGVPAGLLLLIYVFTHLF
jgi:hypothetical protein